MSVEKLVGLLKPPLSPSEVPTELELAAVERELTPLPDDYKEFVRRFGTGCVDDFVWIFNPASKNKHLCLQQQIPKQVSGLEEAAKTADHLPREFHARWPYLMPFGLTDNGDLLFWYRFSSANRWTIVVIAGRFEEYDSFDLGLSEFLFGILSGSLRCSCFPDDFPSRKPRFHSVA